MTEARLDIRKGELYTTKHQTALQNKIRTCIIVINNSLKFPITTIFVETTTL